MLLFLLLKTVVFTDNQPLTHHPDMLLDSLVSMVNISYYIADHNSFAECRHSPLLIKIFESFTNHSNFISNTKHCDYGQRATKGYKTSSSVRVSCKMKKIKSVLHSRNNQKSDSSM